jgi:hypothetical protein
MGIDPITQYILNEQVQKVKPNPGKILQFLTVLFAKKNKGVKLDGKAMSRLKQAVNIEIKKYHANEKKMSINISLPFIAPSENGPVHFKATLSQKRLQTLS